jgi:hypothetical protein
MNRRDALKHAAATAVVAAALARGTAQAAGSSTTNSAACPPYHKKHNPLKQEYVKRHKRLPGLPDRNSLPPEELPGFDYLASRISPEAGGFGGGSLMIDGEPYGVPHFRALAATPVLGFEQGRRGRVSIDLQMSGNSVDSMGHELVDCTLALDSGYYALLAGHAPSAVSAGIRLEAFEALRDHRDDLLKPEELNHVLFLRAVRDGKMTAERWSGMLAHYKGNLRAVVDQAVWMLMLGHHHMFCWAVGAPEMPREQFAQMLADYRSGKTKPRPHREAGKVIEGKVVFDSTTPTRNDPPKGVDLSCPPWHSWATPDRQVYPQRASWFPKMAGPIAVYRGKGTNEVAWDEIGDFEHLMAKIEKAKQGTMNVAGQPYWVDFYASLTSSPRIGAAMSRMQDATVKVAGSNPKTYRRYENDLTSVVLALDSGYHAFVPTETAAAVKAGVRVQAIQALRDHDDKALTADEREHVTFIRAIRDGSMNDDLWDRMKQRIGSERGVLDYTQMVCTRHLLHMWSWCAGVPDMARADFDRLLGSLK